MERTDDLTLEQYLLGELPDREMRRLESLMERDHELRQRAEALRRDNRSFLEQHPRESLLPHLSAARPSRPPARRHLWRWAPLAIPLLWALFVLTPPAEPGSIRTKGGPQGPALFLKVPGRTNPCTEGETLPPGSLVHVSYLSPHPWGLVLSLDGRGRITRHHPLTGDHPARLKPHTRTPLPQAFELDDAPLGELFLLITAQEPFALTPLLRHVREQVRPGSFPKTWDLPPTLSVTSFFVSKPGKKEA